MSDSDEGVLQQLQITNKILAQILIKGSNNQTERITQLYRCGFSSSNIADLLNIKDNIVRATISQIKKIEVKGKKGK
jgi:DNA-binding NarL/FixJ family response regulator